MMALLAQRRGIAMNITRLSICSLVIVFTVLAVGSYVTGSTAPDDTSELLRISILRMNALGANDVATWASYTSDDYQSIQDDGEVLTKSAVVARGKAATYPDASTWVGHPSVRIIGETALVTGKSMETEKFPGGPIFTNFRITILYAKERGRWLAQASQVTVLQKNYTKGMAHPPTALAPSTGRYNWAPGMIDTISSSGSRLVSNLGGPMDPLMFVSANTTTQSDDLGIETFYRDATGKVAGYIYKRCDGQTIRAPKLTDQS
jgi:Domain of unknown function (DUF4440)